MQSLQRRSAGKWKQEQEFGDQKVKMVEQVQSVANSQRVVMLVRFVVVGLLLRFAVEVV